MMGHPDGSASHVPWKLPYLAWVQVPLQILTQHQWQVAEPYLAVDVLLALAPFLLDTREVDQPRSCLP